MKAGHGGVTFSGGEPLLQADDLLPLIQMLQEENIGSCIDTSGNVSLSESVKNVLLAAESVLLDLKFATEEEYLQYANGSLHKVLEMLSFLTEHKIPTRIRTVIVPGINDTEEALQKYAELLYPYKNSITKWELLAFHTLGFMKYEALKINNPLQDKTALSPELCKELQQKADKLLHKN